MDDYTIVEYDPAWVTQFGTIEKMLLEVFGKKALAIEHVGSTSVPGMNGKPIIDVLVTVEHVESTERERKELLKRGYRCQENYIAPHTYLFRKTDEHGNKKENIHLCESDSPKVKQFLVMRDYLRSFPEEAKVYSDFKTQLFTQFPHDYDAYRKAKTPFLDNFEKKAYGWQSENLI